MTERLYRYRYPTGVVSLAYSSTIDLADDWDEGILEVADIPDDLVWAEVAS